MASHDVHPPGRPSIAKAVLAGSLFCHAATVLQFLLVAVPRKLYHEAPGVFLVFLGASAALSAAMYLAGTAAGFRTFLVLRALLLMVFTAPFGPYLDITLTLLLFLIAEISVFEDFPLNLLFSSLVTAGTAATTFLSPYAAGRGGLESISFLLCACLAALVGSIMTLYRQRMVAYGREMQERGSALEKLARAQMGFLDFARTAEERSMLNERNRITAELHDSLGYTFTNLKMVLEASKDLIEIDPGKLREQLETGLEQVNQGMRETRRALYQLRETAATRTPFLTAVHRMVGVFEKSTGVRVTVEYTNFPPDCDEEAASALFHFIQEGLVNSFGHGKASRIRVVLSNDAENLQVRIEDNGRGAGAITEGIGILGMRERLGRLGGTLTVQPMPGGFQIAATIPARE